MILLIISGILTNSPIDVEKEQDNNCYSIYDKKTADSITAPDLLGYNGLLVFLQLSKEIPYCVSLLFYFFIFFYSLEKMKYEKKKNG